MDKTKVKEARFCRIYPNQVAKNQIKENIEATRQTYNYALGLAYADLKSTLGINKLPKNKQSKALYQKLNDVKFDSYDLRVQASKVIDQLKSSDIRKALPRLKTADSTAISYALRDLRRSFSNNLKNPKDFGVPQFKSYQKNLYSGSYHSAKNMTFLKDPTHVKIGKIKEPVLIETHYPVPTDARYYKATIRRDNDEHYYISFAYELTNHTASYPKTGHEIGIDLNTQNNGFVLSDGRKFKMPQDKELNHRLVINQRRLSRYRASALKFIATRQQEQENSSLGDLIHIPNLSEFPRYQKQRLIVAKIQKKIIRQHDSWLKNLAFSIVKNYDFIAIEDLHIKEMTRIKKGHGRKQNRNLNRYVQVSSFRKFRELLEYKANFTDKTVYAIDKTYPSTQICHICGYQNVKLKGNMSIRQWTCPACQTALDSDINAAQNILQEAKIELTKSNKK